MSIFPLTSWYLSLDHKKWHPYTWEVLLLTILSHIYSIMQSKLQVASHLLIVVDFNIVISVDPYQNFHNIKLPLVPQTYKFPVISIILSQVQPIISSIFLIWIPMISSFFYQRGMLACLSITTGDSKACLSTTTRGSKSFLTRGWMVGANWLKNLWKVRVYIAY